MDEPHHCVIEYDTIEGASITRSEERLGMATCTKKTHAEIEKNADKRKGIYKK